MGGAVRDALLGLPPKDFDIEVYGISYERLAGFLSAYGRVDLVGKSFGVVKVLGLISRFPGGKAKPARTIAIFRPPSMNPSLPAKPPAAATSPSTRSPMIRCAARCWIFSAAGKI